MATPLKLTESEVEEVVHRLRRAEGQVKGLQRMLAEGRDCVDVLQQVAAVRAALDRVAIDLIAAAMEKCAMADVEGKPGMRTNRERLRRAFLMLR